MSRWTRSSSGVRGGARALAWLAVVALSGGCGDDASAPDADAGKPDGGTDGGETDAGRDAGPTLDDTPSKGPWLLQVDTDSALVRWESQLEPSMVAVEHEPEAGGATETTTGASRATEVEAGYGVDSPIIEQPDRPGTYYLNEVELTGLEPATCYVYRLVGYPGHEGRLCTMHEPSDHDTPITFLGLGDTSPGLGRTTDILAQVLDEDPEFTVHVGDVQYYSAVVETWQLWFDAMQPLLSKGPMYAAVGNHENELGGIEFPDYYGRFWDQPSEDGNVFRYHYETGGVHFFVFNSEDDIGESGTWESQIEWLDGRMTEAEGEPSYRFSILYFHRPIYTLAEHSPSLSLREQLEPLVEGHSIPLVMQGHNHVYERFEVGETTYLVIGGGGSGLYGIDDSVADYPEEESLRVAKGAFRHGALFRIEGRTISVEIVDDEGTLRDDFAITVP